MLESGPNTRLFIFSNQLLQNRHYTHLTPPEGVLSVMACFQTVDFRLARHPPAIGKLQMEFPTSHNRISGESGKVYFSGKCVNQVIGLVIG